VGENWKCEVGGGLELGNFRNPRSGEGLILGWVRNFGPTSGPVSTGRGVEETTCFMGGSRRSVRKVWKDRFILSGTLPLGVKQKTSKYELVIRKTPVKRWGQKVHHSRVIRVIRVTSNPKVVNFLSPSFE
jgi:hypothetical protein